MDGGIGRVFTNGWVQGAGVALVSALIGAFFLFRDHPQATIYSVAAFGCFFIFILIIVAGRYARGAWFVASFAVCGVLAITFYIAKDFVPIIKMSHKGRLSIDGHTTVPNALPLMRFWVRDPAMSPGDSMIEVAVSLENIGKVVLQEARVQFHVPSGFNLTCVNHPYSFSAIGGDRSARSALNAQWYDRIEIDLGNMNPHRTMDFVLRLEFPTGSWQEDLELRAMMFGKEYPDEGKPPNGTKYSIQKP